MSSNNGFWWWSSAGSGAAAEFDRLLETCTSSNLPSSTPPPITDSLTLSDLIRSSAVPASHAVKSLQKRLDHSNPNVQLLVISVIDVCVKNGGDGFLKEIGTREFSEDCAQIISNPISNREVKEKLKREFQNWALAFEAVPFLASSELVTNYRRLKTIGIEFPPKDPLATAAMVDSMSAPEWRDSDVCERCRTAFSFTNRKHHCRNCGGVFDGQCSSKKRALPHFGVTESVRICDGCERSLAAGIAASTKSGLASARRNSFSGSSSHPLSSKLSSGQNHHRSATIHSPTSARNTHRYTNPTPGQPLGNALSREDADLERAIALSLQDSAPQRTSFSHSNPPANHHQYGVPSRPPVSTGDEEADDPELAAAIAASLREVQASASIQPSAPAPVSPSRSLETLPSRPPLRHQNASEEHINTLLNFSADVDSAIRHRQFVPTNADLNNRHAQAEAALINLSRGIDNAERKTQALREMNEKLSQAVKLYDRLLSDQIMYRTQPSQSIAAFVPNSQPYGPIATSQSDNHYQRNINPGYPAQGLASRYQPNSIIPNAALPVLHNFTGLSTSDSMPLVTTPPHVIQAIGPTSPNSSLQPYGHPVSQTMSSTNHGLPTIAQHQTSYSQEYPILARPNPQLTLSDPMSPSSTEPPRPEDFRTPETTSWGQSNYLPNNPRPYPATTSSDQPPNLQGSSPDVNATIHADSRSSGAHSSTGVQLKQGIQDLSAPNQFSSQSATSNQARQSPYLTSDSVSQPHLHSGDPTLSSHSNPLPGQLVNGQGDPVKPIYQTLQLPLGSSTVPPHLGSPNSANQVHDARNAQGSPMHHLPSAPQTAIESTSTLPSFPSVPTTHLGWTGATGSYNHHQWDQHGLDVSSTRPEEVAPLIEL